MIPLGLEDSQKATNIMLAVGRSLRWNPLDTEYRAYLMAKYYDLVIPGWRNKEGDENDKISS